MWAGGVAAVPADYGMAGKIAWILLMGVVFAVYSKWLRIGELEPSSDDE
jgi:hypothetical protein